MNAVAWLTRDTVDGLWYPSSTKKSENDRPLYTSSPTKLLGPNLVEILNSAGFYKKREWVGLTDDEIKAIVGPWGDTAIKGYTRQLFDQIEAALKEKNT